MINEYWYGDLDAGRIRHIQGTEWHLRIEVLVQISRESALRNRLDFLQVK